MLAVGRDSVNLLLEGWLRISRAVHLHQRLRAVKARVPKQDIVAEALDVTTVSGGEVTANGDLTAMDHVGVGRPIHVLCRITESLMPLPLSAEIARLKHLIL